MRVGASLQLNANVNANGNMNTNAASGPLHGATGANVNAIHQSGILTFLKRIGARKIEKIFCTTSLHSHSHTRMFAYLGHCVWSNPKIPYM